MNICKTTYACIYTYIVGICNTDHMVHFVYHISLQKYGSIRYCITISTERIMCHYIYSLKNQAVVEFVTDKLISTLLYYKYRLLMPLQHIRTHIRDASLSTTLPLRYLNIHGTQYHDTILYCFIDMYRRSLLHT